MTAAMLRPLLHAMSVAGLLALLPTASSLAAQDRRDQREASRLARPPVPKQATLPDLPDLKVSLSQDGETLYLVGMLLDGAYQQVDAALRAAPTVRRVHLSSSGGFTIEGRLVAALVRKHRLDTYVEFYCASACTQIFAAGRERVLGPQARLGFHQAVMVDRAGATAGVRPGTDRKLEPSLVFGVNGNDTLRLAYEMAGTKPAFIAKALSYDYENMWLPDGAELLEAGFVTRVADQSEIPTPSGAISHEVVLEEMLKKPLWQAAMARLPQSTEQALDEVWRTANSGSSFEVAVQIGRTKLVDDAAKLLVEKSDALLDRALTVYVRAARSQRAAGYPGCHSDPLSTSHQRDETDFIAAEDGLLTEVLLSQDRVKPMKPEAATRYFRREVGPLLSEALELNQGLERGQFCRIGFATFEAIDAMPANKRLKAYRALLSMSRTDGT